MKTKNIIINLVTICFIGLVTLFTTSSCGCEKCGKDCKCETECSDTCSCCKQTEKALNVSIYLDLSDRLVRETTPTQMEKDTAIVNYIAKLFVDRSFALGPKLLQSKNHLRVFFYPTPKDSKIVSLADDLDVDLAHFAAGQKKKALLGIKENFSNSLSHIYGQTISDQNWIGSDIWGFFRKSVEVQCIQKDCRNILVILTDGYLYDENDLQKDGDSYSYLTPSVLKNPNASLIVSKTGLDDLEVLMLEINPYNVNQGNKMLPILEGWFKAMGVKNFVAAETELPNVTRTIIDSFFNE